MLNRLNLLTWSLALSLFAIADQALAQRPPSNQGPPQMSFERAWSWLTARPGVMIAIVVLVALVVFMIMSNRRSKT